MIGAEAKIAEGYHAFKSGDLERAERLLTGLPHPRAEALLALIAKACPGKDTPSIDMD